MSLVLVDTSIWIAFLRTGDRPGWHDALVELLDRDRVVVVDPVIAELLIGARGDRERSAILAISEGARTAVVDRPAWRAAGDLGRSWRARGRTLGLIDCLLATVGLRDHLELWTLDKDFDPLFSSGEHLQFSPR